MSVVKATFAQEEKRWDEKEYMTEMDRRFADMESGTVKGITLEELEASARQSYKEGNKQAH